MGLQRGRSSPRSGGSSPWDARPPSQLPAALSARVIPRLLVSFNALLLSIAGWAGMRQQDRANERPVGAACGRNDGQPPSRTSESPVPRRRHVSDPDALNEIPGRPLSLRRADYARGFASISSSYFLGDITAVIFGRRDRVLRCFGQVFASIRPTQRIEEFSSTAFAIESPCIHEQSTHVNTSHEISSRFPPTLHE